MTTIDLQLEILQANNPGLPNDINYKLVIVNSQLIGVYDLNLNPGTNILLSINSGVFVDVFNFNLNFNTTKYGGTETISVTSSYSMETYFYYDNVNDIALSTFLTARSLTNMQPPSPNPVCFNEGTRILCLENGEEMYKPIEQLKRGDLIVTYKHGSIPIDLIASCKIQNDPENKMTMYIDNKNNLIVTGHHSILVESINEEEYEQMGKKMKLDDKYMLYANCSKGFQKQIDSKEYTIYHFCLKGPNKQYGIWANGVLTETCSKKKLIRKMNI